MSEVNFAAAGYLYRGTLEDAPAPRRCPGLRPASMPSRVLQALADLDGEAATTEIRRRVLAESAVPAPRRVPDALHRLARMTPPAVTAVGDPRGGRGKTQRWRLTGGGP